MRRIQDELLPERVHHSNAIEGNTLEFRETRMILETGKLIPAKRREALESRNLGEAARALSNVAIDDTSVDSVERLLEIHRTVLREVNDEWAGRFREHGVKIQGATWKPPHSSIVPSMVERVLARLAIAGDEPPLLMGVWAHWALAAIHPFSGRNGRTARLWQDLVFYQRGLTCAVIQAHQRRQYFDAIQAADDGCFDPLVQFIGQSMLSVFNRYLAELGKETEDERWVDELVGGADARATEIRHREYLIFTRMMERLRFEFSVYAGKINERSAEIDIQLREYAAIDRQAWENLIRGLRAEQTWFFTIDVRRGQVSRKYYFFFGKHFWSPELDTTEERRAGASLLISEHDPASGKGIGLDEIANCPISLREVFVVEKRLVRRRFELHESQNVYDRDVDPSVIARDFYHDVILNRLT